MTGTGFLIIFGLSCVLLPCEGQVIPPSNGTKLIFLPGSTVKIDWSYVANTSQVQLRKWLFKSSDGSRTGELTSVYLDNTRDPLNTALIPRFEIEKPATLVLKNVDETYNGNYTFSLQKKSSFVPDLSEVVVDIAAKPNVTFSCYSPITVDEGDDFTCVCRGEGGNPPADVAWFKDGVQIGGTRKEIITLTRNNVNETDSGTYKCEARSHSNTMFVDAKTIELIVKPNSKPNKTNITFKPDPATVGYPVEIMCESEGVPEPSFIIMRNGKSVSTEKTYTIHEVKQSDEGPYTCIAVNILGNDSATDNLTVIDKPTAMVNCPSRNEVNEGGDFTCVCSSEGGIPENNATWFKKGVQIGETRKENVTLNLTDVNATDGGTYKCVAQSYFGEAFKDEKSIELIVRLNSQPNNTSITFTPNQATVGNQVEIRCDSEGVPEPSFIIMRNGKNVSTEKTYTISLVKQSDEGPYACIAVNILGNDSATDNLTVIDPTPTTTPTSASTSSPDLSTGAIIGIIIGVLVLIIIVGVVVYCCKSKEKERSNSCANIDPVPGNSHELGEPGPSDGAYDTVWPVGTSESKSKPPVEKNALPPVYAAVDKNNREGNTLYASLDNEALKSSRASKKEPDRPQQTEYASIDFAKTGNAPKEV